MRAVWRCIRHSNGALEQVGGRHTPFACAPRDLLTYAWSRPRHSMPRAPCPRRATPSDQPSARAPSQRAYLAFSPDPPTNDRAGALPTTEHDQPSGVSSHLHAEFTPDSHQIHVRFTDSRVNSRIHIFTPDSRRIHAGFTQVHASSRSVHTDSTCVKM